MVLWGGGWCWGREREREMGAYIFDHLVENRHRRALTELNLVGDSCLLNYWQPQFVVLPVDVHGQDLQSNQHHPINEIGLLSID